MEIIPTDIVSQVVSKPDDSHLLIKSKPQTTSQPDILEMADEDSTIVSNVIDEIITEASGLEGATVESRSSNKSSSPPSLDYGDLDDPDNSKENGLAKDGADADRTRGDSTPSSLNLDSDYLLDSNTDVNIDETPEYVVEEVIAKRDKEGNAQYNVKWKGFPSNSNTWEPVDNLCGCDKVVEQFELRSAKRLAERNCPSSNENQLPQGKRRQSFHSKEFEINDVMGLTTVQGEMYFLVSLSNSTIKTFIRASLANRIIPGKVIDFYIKSMKWKAVCNT